MFIEKASATARDLGSGTAVVSAATVKAFDLLGFSPADWQIVGIIGGLAIGFIGMALNAGINAYFGWQRLKLDRANKGQ